MRTWRTVVSVGALALVLSGCSAVTGRPFATWTDDKSLNAHVKSAIVAVSFKSITRVDVDVYEGTVYLSGRVDDADTKARTEAAAARVDGVRQVVSHLIVREHRRDAVMPSALPRAVAVAERPVPAPLVGVVRLEGDHAFDRGGRHVATVHVVPMNDLAHTVAERFEAPRGVSHVTIHAMEADTHVPVPHYLVVLWHDPAPTRP